MSSLGIRSFTLNKELILNEENTILILKLLSSLIDRAYKINSTWLGFHQETTKISDFLLKNSYPAHIIDKAINSTINSSLTGKMATTAQSVPMLNYLTLEHFLLLLKSGFAEPFSVFVTTALISS